MDMTQGVIVSVCNDMKECINKIAEHQEQIMDYAMQLQNDINTLKGVLDE